MPDRIKPDREIVDSPIEYAFWLEKDGPARVQYSLPAFHEIDFQVNEGYRRIPHGGVEIGGVLWGRRDDGAVVLEAFRQIECEHASGPSFSLSERDLAGIEELLTRARSEEELRSLEPVGWFVAHTRSPLTLTDRELALFDRFFPGSGKVTMLVKPERFQPTRFGLLVRRDDGSVVRDAAAGAFILPLPGRAGKGVVASIPAPAVKRANGPVEMEVKEPVPDSVSASVPVLPVEVGEPPPAAVPEPAPSSTSAEVPLSSGGAESRPALAFENLRSATDSRSAPTSAEIPLSPGGAESRPALATEKRKEQFRGKPPEIPPPLPPPLPAPVGAGRSSASAFRLFLLLVVAAGLGCAVGYLAYLQLPSPYIALEVQKQASGLFVQWPAAQTKGVEYAAVRVDDGPPQLLTEREKESGQMEVQARTNNTKVEIIAQHWIRDSRGIVRYVGVVSAASKTGDAGAVPGGEPRF